MYISVAYPKYYFRDSKLTGPEGRKSMPKAGEKVVGEVAASRFPTSHGVTVSGAL